MTAVQRKGLEAVEMHSMRAVLAEHKEPNDPNLNFRCDDAL